MLVVKNFPINITSVMRQIAKVKFCKYIKLEFNTLTNREA